MKTSNKILLIFFLTATLLITAVHVALYAKYKRGDYVSFDKISKGRFDQVALPRVKYVSITGLQRCNIFPDAEPKMKIFRMKNTRLSYRIVNDTLVIKGDSVLQESEQRNHQTINLYLPGNETINAVYTGVFVSGGADTASAPSWQFNISNRSSLTTNGSNNQKGFFERLHINANASYIKFDQPTVINNLSVQGGAQTMITNERADIKHVQLSIDSTSTIVLQGKGVNDIKFNTKD